MHVHSVWLSKGKLTFLGTLAWEWQGWPCISSCSAGAAPEHGTVQVATVGYGDITPQTPGEEAVAIFVFLLGIIFFGVLIGSLTQLLQRASKDARKAQLYREKMESVEAWLRARHFPARLRVSHSPPGSLRPVVQWGD